MYKPINEQGSVLAGAFLVSVALGIAMTGLIVSSRSSNKQAAALLSKAHLSRIAREKFTQDLIALNKNVDIKTSTATFPLGEAETFFQTIPGGSLYIVVVATLAKTNLPEPRHIRLETLVEISRAPELVVKKRTAVSDVVNNLLRHYISEDDPQFSKLREEILQQLQDKMEEDTEFVQYRGAAVPTEEEGTFYLQPISVNISKPGLRVRAWKEKTY